jgi:hypothetical protein
MDPPEAYRNDDRPSTVYVVVPGGHFAALRLDGTWKRASLTIGHLEENYRRIDDPDLAMRFYKSAKHTLSG